MVTCRRCGSRSVAGHDRTRVTARDRARVDDRESEPPGCACATDHPTDDSTSDSTTTPTTPRPDDDVDVSLQLNVTILELDSMLRQLRDNVTRLRAEVCVCVCAVARSLERQCAENYNK